MVLFGLSGHLLGLILLPEGGSGPDRAVRRGAFEGWSMRAPTNVSKTNDPGRSDWPDSHTRTRGGGFEK